jgi:hypothetical protein
MLLGHIAIGLGSKKYAPRISLGTLVLASGFADILWLLLSMLGIEHFRIVRGYTLMSSYDMYDTPFSHGLLANLVLAILFGGIYFLFNKDRRASMVLCLVVLSHWILDFITHRPDMVLISNSWPRVGLELWSSYWGTICVEIGLFIIGMTLYIKTTNARRRQAWLPLILLILYSSTLFIGSFFAAPPENIFTLCVSSLIIFLIFIVLAYWTDMLRNVK